MTEAEHRLKNYSAVIWTKDPAHPGQRVTVLAENLKEAKEKFETEYGVGNVFDLHNVEDASQPR